jgi:flagellar protein FliO/FliZ
MSIWLNKEEFANPTGDLLWVLFVLALMVGLIVLILRFFAKRNRGWWMNRTLRSLGGFPLGANKSMQIVEWNNRIYVLGIGENVTLLESITDSEAVAVLLAEHETVNSAPSPGMPAWLRRWAEKRNPPEDGGDRQPEPSLNQSFEKTLESRLRQLSERKQRVEQLLEDSDSEDRSGKQ